MQQVCKSSKGDGHTATSENIVVKSKKGVKIYHEMWLIISITSVYVMFGIKITPFIYCQGNSTAV